MFTEARQLQKSKEQNRPLHMAFIDLTKAYDTVNRQALWQLLFRYGVPWKLVAIIRSLHEGMNGMVRIKGELSEPFNISNGLRQGCVIAPNLSKLFLPGSCRRRWLKHHQVLRYSSRSTENCLMSVGPISHRAYWSRTCSLLTMLLCWLIVKMGFNRCSIGLRKQWHCGDLP